MRCPHLEATMNTGMPPENSATALLTNRILIRVYQRLKPRSLDVCFTLDSGRVRCKVECPLSANSGHRQSRRVASIDGEIPTDYAIVTATSANASSESDASIANTSTTVTTDFHRPIPVATG